MVVTGRDDEPWALPGRILRRIKHCQLPHVRETSWPQSGCPDPLPVLTMGVKT
jgi:hypothetical protein